MFVCVLLISRGKDGGGEGGQTQRSSSLKRVEQPGSGRRLSTIRAGPFKTLSKLFRLFRTRQKHLLNAIIFNRTVLSSVTRFGDLLDFGQLFEAFVNN